MRRFGCGRTEFARVAISALCGVAIVLVPGLGAWAGAAGSLDEPADLGDIAVVQPANQGRLLGGGMNATLYGIRLPEDATCPGDSRNDDWRIQSFMIPKDEDPLDLKYGLVSPEGQNRYPLFTADTTTYMQVFLRPNEGPGEPGIIEPVPALSFAALEPGSISTGGYRIGVACTYFRESARVWDTVIEVVVDPDDSTKFSWSVPSENTALPEAAGGSATNVVAVPVAIFIFILGALFIRSRTPNKKERT